MELKLIDEKIIHKERLFSIYEEAFPDNERIPTDDFFAVIREYGCTPLAIYDGEDVVGFTCVMHNVDYRIGYLWYFAIAVDCRNRGLGGKALRLLQDKYSDSQLVLDMERLNPKADNIRQRISRLHFYERNGFARAFVGMSYFGMDYELMCNKPPLRLDGFKCVISNVARGLFQPVFSSIVQRRVLFLHGFFASGQCVPAIALRKALAGIAEVVAPDLPTHPREALALIERLCSDTKPDVIVGNSCGAFYAQQIACAKGIPALLGNPHFEMTKFLRERIGCYKYKSPRLDGRQEFTIDENLIGEFAAMEAHQFDHSGKIVGEEASGSEDMAEKVWGLFGDADTLAHYEPLFLRHYVHSFHFPGGHTPTDEEVRRWYAPLVERLLECNEPQ